VIDPSSLIDISGWGQKDYHAFWVGVIDQYAERILFLDGWQYSDGATTEFIAAIRLGLPTFTEHLSPLTVDDGKDLLRVAIEEYESVGLDPKLLRRSLNAADQVVPAARPRRET
jgi:hypothetical protein